MNDRIKAIMQHYNLSATQFATEIGIQRSALSHIMSGRNKPSLDFVLKLKNRYDEINTDWFLYGKGKMIGGGNPVKRDTVKQGTLNLLGDDGNAEAELPLAKSEDSPKYGSTARNNPAGNKKESPLSVDKGDLEIEKIIVFYKNGRFKSYKPE